ncbi:MAG TPA: sirohydrochlorin cobaltochelatase [Tissierellaceae bacterium]|nr:sirohydrochlorin cobaltochelatase [Tissierellaceae bacterium]
MKKGIIVASFGTSYEETRKKTIEKIEDKIKEEYKDDYVLGAFTSRMVINKLKEKDNLHILNEVEAIEDMKGKGIEDIYIQPTHIIEGHEYEKLTDLGVKVGKPLLYSDLDYKTIVEDLDLGKLEKDQAIVFMGHGSDHIADKSYDKLQDRYNEIGKDKVFLATVEGSRTLEDIMKKLEEKDIKRVKLMPFMFVAGDHATNDMASNDEDSWKTILESNGYEVEVVLKGLGEYKVIQNLYLKHLQDVMEEK